jgi:CheY-like chemotaxis protein
MHTILVADDSVTIQRAVEIVFDKEPFTVIKAGSAAEAISRAKADAPSLVLADHTMADHSGYDLAAALRADPATAGIPVMLLSAAANPYDEGRGSAAGIVGFVQKPFDCATLLDRVRTVLGVAATPPGSFVSAAAPAMAASSMPRPPSLGGLPRPPGVGGVPSFAPRPAVAAAPGVPTPAAPAAPAARAAPAPAAPAAPAPAAPVAATSSPFSSPNTVAPAAAAPAANAGWLAMSPGAGLPATTVPPVAVAETPAPPAPPAPPVAPPQPARTATPVPAVPVLARTLTPALEVMAIGDADSASAGFELAEAVSTPDLTKTTARIAIDELITTEEPPLPAVAVATATVVAQAAPAIAALTGEAPSTAALSAEAKAIIERICWEIVPELAEVIIKEELQRLLKARNA